MWLERQKATLRAEEGAGDLLPSIKLEAALRVKEVITGGCVSSSGKSSLLGGPYGLPFTAS